MLNSNAVAPIYSVFQAAHTPNRFCRYDNASTDKTDFCYQASMCPAQFCKQGRAALNFRFSFQTNSFRGKFDFIGILCYDEYNKDGTAKWCKETKNAPIFENQSIFEEEKYLILRLILIIDSRKPLILLCFSISSVTAPAPKTEQALLVPFFFAEEHSRRPSRLPLFNDIFTFFLLCSFLKLFQSDITQYLI